MAAAKDLQKAAQTLFKRAQMEMLPGGQLSEAMGAVGKRFGDAFLSPNPGPTGIQPKPGEAPTAASNASLPGIQYTPSRAPYMLTGQQMDVEQGIPQQQTWDSRRYGLVSAPGAAIQGAQAIGRGGLQAGVLTPLHAVAEGANRLGVPGAATVSEAVGDFRARGADYARRGWRQMTNPLFDRSADSQLASEAERAAAAGHPVAAGAGRLLRNADVIGSHAAPNVAAGLVGKAVSGVSGLAKSSPMLAKAAPWLSALIPGLVGDADSQIAKGQTAADAYGQSQGLPASQITDDPAPAVYDVRQDLPGGQVPNDWASRASSAAVEAFFPDVAEISPADAISRVQQLPAEHQAPAAKEFVEGAVEANIRGGLPDAANATPEQVASAKAELAKRTLAGQNTPEEVSRGLQTSAGEHGVDPTHPGIIEQLLNYWQNLQPPQKMLLAIGIPLALAGLAAGAFGDDWLLGGVLGLGGLLAIGSGMGDQQPLQPRQQPPAVSSNQPAQPKPQPTQAPPRQAPVASANDARSLFTAERAQQLTAANPVLQPYAAGGATPQFEQDDLMRLFGDYRDGRLGWRQLMQLQSLKQQLTPDEQKTLQQLLAG
jgi:hypothetical protein